MLLVIPHNVRVQLREALVHAGRKEIGGILMGQDLGADRFRVSEVSVQMHGGTFASFVRLVQDCLAPLQRFFQTTKNNFKRFNYMGEWHSHHSFALVPSLKDHKSMFGIIEDDRVGANFVVLFLVKLNHEDGVDGAVVVYVRNRTPYFGEVIWEDAQITPNEK